MKLPLIVPWISSTERNRDSTSPTCRFSKNDTGSRTRCWNTLELVRRFQVMEAASSTHPRSMRVTVSVTSKRKIATDNTISRLRSPVTTTSSISHWLISGSRMPKDSRASDSSSTCVKALARPGWLSKNARRSRRVRSTLGWKSARGDNSIATPEKRLPTSSFEYCRRPSAGSLTTMPREFTSTSTTKWLSSQCRMQGRDSRDSSSTSRRTARALSLRSAAISTSRPSVVPLSETGWRCRSISRSVS